MTYLIVWKNEWGCTCEQKYTELYARQAVSAMKAKGLAIVAVYEITEVTADFIGE